ncbi:hypothetical protein C8J56DRAFT_565243 [Mycena floridula]|nr:hypothetical protein C8J56DRAFT_565243 [Mycena floridula]
MFKFENCVPHIPPGFTFNSSDMPSDCWPKMGGVRFAPKKLDYDNEDPPPLSKEITKDTECWVYGFELTDSMLAAIENVSGRRPAKLSYDRKMIVLYEMTTKLRIPWLWLNIEDSQHCPELLAVSEDVVYFATMTASCFFHKCPVRAKLQKLCEDLGAKEAGWIQLRV